MLQSVKVIRTQIFNPFFSKPTFFKFCLHRTKTIISKHNLWHKKNSGLGIIVFVWSCFKLIFIIFAVANLNYFYFFIKSNVSKIKPLNKKTCSGQLKKTYKKKWIFKNSKINYFSSVVDFKRKFPCHFLKLTNLFPYSVARFKFLNLSD